MPINLNDFLEALSGERLPIKKIAARAVIDYRNTRDAEIWNNNLNKIVALGVAKQRLTKYFLNV